MNGIDIDQVVELFCDQQPSTGWIDLYLGRIGMRTAQQSCGSGNRMQVSLTIDLEAGHVGRCGTPVGGIEDIEQAIMVAQADRADPAGGKNTRKGEMPMVDIDD